MKTKRFDKPTYGHKSYYSAANGVYKYTLEYARHIYKGLDINQRRKKLHSIVKQFLIHEGIEHKTGKSYKSLFYNCNLVQENFDKFKQYLNNENKV